MEKLKNWSDFRAAGVICRAFLASEDNKEASVIISKYITDETDEIKTKFERVEKLLAKNYYPSRNLSVLRGFLEENAKAMGPSSYLALSDLSSFAVLKTPAALLALHVHVLFLKQANTQFVLECSGQVSDEKSLTWPNVYPQKYEALAVQPDASFTYKVNYVVDGKTEKTHNLTLKTMKLGAKMMINAVFEEDSHFSLEVNIKDYIPSSNNFAKDYETCVGDFSSKNQGFAKFLSRAALTLLSNQVAEKLLDPIFNIICPEDMRVNRGTEKTNSDKTHRNPESTRSPLLIEQRSPLQLPGGRPLYPGYGDSDLMPNLGGHAPIGGNLFGPGHPGFGSTRPNLPQGVPPGARYDPMGPGGPPNSGSGRMGRRGRRNGGDHLPPPSFNGGGFSGF